MNKGKGTYTEAERIKARLPENRAYHRKWAKENRYRYIDKLIQRQKNYQTTINYRFAYYKRNAKMRGFLFPLNKQQLEEIVSKPCVYCGRSDVPFNGIDRTDSNIGYESKNCVPCCFICNRMKMDLSLPDFIQRCSEIVEKFKDIQL